MSSVLMHLDEALERVIRLRERLLADPFAEARAERLALLFESEARAWSQVYELAHLRLIWRAALAAEAGARANAARWTRRAVAERAGWMPGESWAVGRVAAPRPVALTTGGGGR